MRLVHTLQRLLAHSWYARLLAVRRVSQDNTGKRTAGIDGIKSLSPPQRLEMAQSLHHFSCPRPLRRIWIPKPGKSEKRPLSIPTMRDRATQALIKLALEPQWEAQLDPNMYGFRPGRSAQDAIEAIFNSIHILPKYVLSVDIRGCFDNISHAAILNKSQTPLWMKRLIRGWLQCGVLDNGFQRTERGSPQGGVISPLLALMALSGLEPTLKTLGSRTAPIHVVAYADDIVVLSRQLTDIHRAKAKLNQWLGSIGLALNPEKTTIAHTLNGEDAGFDFLGFHIQHYPVGKYQKRRGFTTRITPSEKNVKRHLNHLKSVIHAHRGQSQQKLIACLNPIIRGWCNYFRSVASTKTFATMSHYLFYQLWGWAKHRHNNLNRHQIASRYWLVQRGGGWVFQARGKTNALTLRTHSNTRFRKHIKVQAHRSVYDGDWIYWGKRLRSYAGLAPRTALLLRQHDGKCAHCGLTVLPTDLIETHHRDGHHHNNLIQNLALLHRHCHDQVHTAELLAKTGTHDKSLTREEPDNAKVSRPVLKPNLGGASQI